MKSLAVLVLLSCGPHEDYTPLIHVEPNAAARIDWLSHKKNAEQAAPQPARVHPMKVGEELGGSKATGRVGDLVIENDEVLFVVAAGKLVDAADAHARIDELGEATSSLGAVYTSRTSGTFTDGSALIEVRGYEHDNPGLVVGTRYTLHPNDRAVVIDTTLENTTTQPVTLDLGDAVDWGSADAFAPDRGRAFGGGSKGAFVGAVGAAASYALTTPDGIIEADTMGEKTTTFQKRHVEVAAGGSARYQRIFLVGPRADVSGLVAELTKMSGGEVGSVRVSLLGEGKPLTVANPVIEVGDSSGKAIMDVRGDAQGAIAAELPPGKYAFRYQNGAPQQGEVVAGRELTVSLDTAAGPK